MITIVHISDCLRNHDKSYTYIGRANPSRKLARSPLANPYPVGRKYSREEACDLYKTEVLDPSIKKRTGATYEALMELAEREKRGEEIRLACWCTSEETNRTYQRCHGHSIRTAVIDLSTSLPINSVATSNANFIPGLDHSKVKGNWIPNSKWWEKSQGRNQ